MEEKELTVEELLGELVVAIQSISDRLDVLEDVRDRLASIEERLAHRRILL